MDIGYHTAAIFVMLYVENGYLGGLLQFGYQEIAGGLSQHPLCVALSIDLRGINTPDPYLRVQGYLQPHGGIHAAGISIEAGHERNYYGASQPCRHLIAPAL